MKKQIVILLSLIFSISSLAVAQTKTVTNADLEKFRQKRLQNERQYRDNYKRLGFPSPEELERKRVEDQKDLIEFSQQLEIQRLQREAAQAEARNQALWMQNQVFQSRLYSSDYQTGYGAGYSPYYYGYGGYYNYYQNRFRGVNNNLLYDSSTFRQNNPNFFNLQFPPPRPPQRIFAPGRRPFNPRIGGGNSNTQITIRPGRVRN